MTKQPQQYGEGTSDMDSVTQPILKRIIVTELLTNLLAIAFGLSLTSLAQAEAHLDIDTYAGLTITGVVGKVYSVECLNEVSAEDWKCLEFAQLLESTQLWVDKSAPVKKKRFYRAVQMDAPTNMVWIPSGTFRMGSPTNEVDRFDREGPQTEVTLSRGFLMGKYEVTQSEWEALMGNNPSWFNGDRTANGWQDYGTDLTRPVESVSWYDTQDYCAALTARERAAGRIPVNSTYRLPTEAEWEYACRAWTSTRFSYGDDAGYTNLNDYAWTVANSGGRTHPVGQKRPNPWGLCDMEGNVFEWCQDWWSRQLPGGIGLDPQGPPSGVLRVYRGGSWSHDGENSRSAARFVSSEDGPSSVGGNFGFRVVLAPDQP